MAPFWILTFASATSKMGNTFLRLAVPIAIFVATGSPFAAIATVALENLPNLAGPWLGALIDRFPRRNVFVVSELLQAVLVALIPFLLVNDAIWAIYICLLFLGAGSVISNLTSDFGLIPSLVPEDEIGKAYSRYNFWVSIARFLGPLLGGILMAATSVETALLIDAASFVLTAVVVWKLKVGGEPIDPGVGIVASFKAGWAEFIALPDIRRLTWALSIYNLGVGSIGTVIVAIGVSKWSWSPVDIGAVVSVAAIAAALGSGLGDRLARGWPWGRRITLWMAASASASILLLAPVPLIACAAFILMSFAAGPMNVATMALRHEQIDPAFIGRVNAIVRAFIMGAIPASALLLGWTSTSSYNLIVFLPVVVGSVLAVFVWHAARGYRRPTTEKETETHHE